MKEKYVQSAVRHLLQLLENQGKLLFLRNNSGALKTNRGFMHFGKTGSPDFFIFLPGKTIHLETKSDSGKLSEPQIQWRNTVERFGHHYRCISSVDALEMLLREFQVI